MTKRKSPGYKTRKLCTAKVTKRWIKDIDEHNTESVILTPYTEFKDMFLTEVSRGCGRNCRFCMAGYCYRIPRHRSLDKVLERAEFGSKHKDKIGLVGAAVSDYPFIDQLAEQLVENNIKFSVSSLRADTLREPLMQGLAFSGHKTLTIAPEAGSDRLRQVINKGITDEHVINSVKLAHKYRVDNLKLYYIIGLPGESDEDLKEMVDFIIFKGIHESHREQEGNVDRKRKSLYSQAFYSFSVARNGACKIAKRQNQFPKNSTKT